MGKRKNSVLKILTAITFVLFTRTALADGDRSRVEFKCVGRDSVSGQVNLQQIVNNPNYRTLRSQYFGSGFFTGENKALKYAFIFSVGKGKLIKERGMTRLCISSVGMRDLSNLESYYVPTEINTGLSCSLLLNNGDEFALGAEHDGSGIYDECRFRVFLFSEPALVARPIQSPPPATSRN
jgi:hypothetical protein